MTRQVGAYLLPVPGELQLTNVTPIQEHLQGTSFLKEALDPSTGGHAAMLWQEQAQLDWLVFC